jgi:hypothetical protein
MKRGGGGGAGAGAGAGAGGGKEAQRVTSSTNFSKFGDIKTIF